MDISIMTKHLIQEQWLLISLFILKFAFLPFKIWSLYGYFIFITLFEVLLFGLKYSNQVSY